MIYDDDSPQISAADLRDALRSKESTPHRGLAQLVSETGPEPDTDPEPVAAPDPDEGRGELVALRASVATLSEKVEALEADNEQRRERELALRGALRHLAHVRGRRRKRTLIEELRDQGLL